MKKLLLTILLAIQSLAFAQGASGEIDFTCDVTLPLGGVNVVRLYERTGPAAAYVYVKVAEVPVASAALTGTLAVTFPKVPVQADGILRTYVSRTAGVSTLPTSTASLIGESVDSNIATVSIAPGAAAPKSQRITTIVLKP